MSETLSDLRVRFGAFTLDTVGCTFLYTIQITRVAATAPAVGPGHEP